MKILLKNPVPELKERYKEMVVSFIDKGLISLEEWNSRFKNFRDASGYSIIHYFEAVLTKMDAFMTLNPIMLKNREELEKRFKVKIISPGEFEVEDG